MKILVMCEGPNEKKILDILLRNNKLIFCEDDLLGLTIYHARQIEKSAQVRTELNQYPGEIKIFRVGDTQSDDLKVPKDYIHKITGIEKYCTKPEVEILLIIAEGLMKDYEKVKSKVKAKEFAKAHICYNKKKYDNSTQFYEDYFGNRLEILVNCIREYSQRRRKTHEKGEYCLADLLK